MSDVHILCNVNVAIVLPIVDPLCKLQKEVNSVRITAPLWGGGVGAFLENAFSHVCRPAASGCVRAPHGPNIYKDTNPYMSSFLKNLPVKVLGGR